MDKNRREYYRTEVTVPAKWRVLDEKEKELAKKGLGLTLLGRSSITSPIDELLEQSSPGSEEEQLYRCLQLLNSKLDFVIEHMFFGSTDSATWSDRIVEVSGSGFQLLTRKKLNSGTLLLVELIMPGTFRYQMELIGEVMRAKAKDNGFVTAVRIIDIDEESRDAIVKIVFQKQRQDIRKGKVDQDEKQAG